MDVTLIDSPVANSANIARALRAVGASLRITSSAEEIARAEKLVFPGVGSFAAAMSWLTSHRIDAAIREAVDRGAMLLGICVGHQLLFDVSFEMGVTPGLGLIRGEVRKFEGTLPVPQIGWNRVWVSAELPLTPDPSPRRRRGEGNQNMKRSSQVEICFQNNERQRTTLFANIPNGTPFYFVNSYVGADVDSEIAHADYGGSFTAAVRRERIFGVQFHPEKSSSAGLQLLRNFVAWT